MNKEEVIEAIDKLINLERQKRSILIDFEDVIASYADNHPLSFSFEECDYTISLLENTKEEINKYWDEGDNNTDLDESKIIKEEDGMRANKKNPQDIRNKIYSMLIENSSYFRSDFGGMFDSDDDVESEINDIVRSVKEGKPIKYVKEPRSDFNEELLSLVKEYIRLGGRDDITAADGI